MSPSRRRNRAAWWWLGVVLAGLIVVAPAPAAFAVEAENSGAETASDTAGDSCQAVPIFARPACKIATGSATAGGLVGAAISSGAEAALQAIVDWVVGGASWLLGEVVGLIDSSTRPDVRQGWFSVAYEDMAAIALLIMLPLLLVSIIQAVIRQSFSHLVKAVAVYVPVAAVGMFTAVVVVDHLVIITDELGTWIGRSTGTNLADFSRDVGTALGGIAGETTAAGGAALPGFAALLGAGVIGFASFVIWVLLVLRQAAIHVAVLFLPLAFAALVWPTTAHWLRRLLEGLVAIIMSKFVIVAVMAMASGALSAVGDEGFPVIVSGGALLLMAAFAPFVLLRLIPVFEAGLASQLDGTTNSRTSPVSGPTAGGVYRGVRQARAASAARIGGSGASAGGPLALAGVGAATGGIGMAATGAAKVGAAVKSTAGDAAGVATPGADGGGSSSGAPPAAGAGGSGGIPAREGSGAASRAATNGQPPSANGMASSARPTPPQAAHTAPPLPPAPTPSPIADRDRPTAGHPRPSSPPAPTSSG